MFGYKLNKPSLFSSSRFKQLGSSEWNDLLVRHLPGRFLLASLLAVLGTAGDLPWIAKGAVPILFIRVGMVLSLLLFAWISMHCRHYKQAEWLVLIGTMLQIAGVAGLVRLEENYWYYTTGVYQILVFIVVFIPLRTFLYSSLLLATGLLWFLAIPQLLSLQIDHQLLAGHMIEYIVFSIMLIVGSKLFLRLRLFEVLRRSKLIDRARQFREMATRDALTGAHNYRMFEELFPKVIEESVEKGQPLCLCIIDLDDFKMVNDRFGHAAGNQLLQAAVQALKAQIRQHDYLFRIGGDEFAILLTQATLQDAERIGHRILDSFAYLKDIEDTKGLEVKCSIGIAALDDKYSTAEVLFEAADQALYEAKEGREARLKVVTSNFYDHKYMEG